MRKKRLIYLSKKLDTIEKYMPSFNYEIILSFGGVVNN
jgi:hypothetical protein